MKYGESKKNSHQKNVEVWRELSGRTVLSIEEQYFTLADNDSIEYESMKELGIIQNDSQYHMVNRDSEKLAILKQKFPSIPQENFHHGDWAMVMHSASPCPRGGIVYVDTMSEPDGKHPIASTLLGATMDNCGPRTLICPTSDSHGTIN